MDVWGWRMDYLAHDMTALSDLVRRKEVAPEELLRLALERADALNDDIGAIVLRFDDIARAKIKAGLPEGAFTGVPFLLKDLATEAVDFPSHCGSHLLKDTVYSVNSTLVERLIASGLVVFGRTASPEGGIGAATEAAVYGAPTRNPWDLSRTAGGSSGGAGAAVAAGILPGAHGSDGGGSVRIPASHCGLFGFKPTRARLPSGPSSGEGWAGMAIDGFLTRSVRDSAALLDICAGGDAGAPYAAPAMTESFTEAAARAPRRLRIALCDTTLTGAPIDPSCRAAVQDAARLLEDLGHVVVPARPETADTEAMMVAWTKIVACGTALWVRGALEAKGRALQQGDVENVVQSAVAYAATVSGADYLDAVSMVHRYGRQMAGFFEDWDVLLTPTMAEPPAKIGRFDHTRPDYLDYRMGPDGIFAYSPFTASFNATGQPATSVPLTWSDEGLPIGIHFAMAFGEDAELMALAAQLEKARPWFDRMAPLARARH
jgi:amidase/6-aminohexanoate-cyclic-dimer hydrolase